MTCTRSFEDFLFIHVRSISWGRMLQMLHVRWDTLTVSNQGDAVTYHLTETPEALDLDHLGFMLMAKVNRVDDYLVVRIEK